MSKKACEQLVCDDDLDDYYDSREVKAPAMKLLTEKATITACKIGQVLSLKSKLQERFNVLISFKQNGGEGADGVITMSGTNRDLLYKCRDEVKRLAFVPAANNATGQQATPAVCIAVPDSISTGLLIGKQGSNIKTVQPKFRVLVDTNARTITGKSKQDVQGALQYYLGLTEREMYEEAVDDVPNKGVYFKNLFFAKERSVMSRYDDEAGVIKVWGPKRESVVAVVDFFRNRIREYNKEQQQ